MLFDDPEGIGGGHGAVLAGVARQDEPSMARPDHPDQFGELPRADLAGFIDDDDGILGELILLQEMSKGVARQSVGLQILDLLALGSQHDHRALCRRQAALDLLQGETLAGAGAASKQRDEIPTSQDFPHGCALLRRKTWRDLVAEAQRCMPVAASLRAAVWFSGAEHASAD